MARNQRVSRHFLTTEDGHITAVVIPVDEYEQFLTEFSAMAAMTRGLSGPQSKPAKKKKAKSAKKGKARRRR